MNSKYFQQYIAGFVTTASASQSVLEQNEISNNVVYANSKGSDQPAHMRSLIRAFVSRLNILRLQTEQHLEFLSLKGGYTGLS